MVQKKGPTLLHTSSIIWLSLPTPALGEINQAAAMQLHSSLLTSHQGGTCILKLLIRVKSLSLGRKHHQWNNYRLRCSFSDIKGWSINRKKVIKIFRRWGLLTDLIVYNLNYRQCSFLEIITLAPNALAYLFPPLTLFFRVFQKSQQEKVMAFASLASQALASTVEENKMCDLLPLPQATT